MQREVRLAIDIGGTFTDLAVETAPGPDRTTTTAKTLTTHDAPERGVIEGISGLLHRAGIETSDVTMIIYGTTLATNLLIERKGERTALITTQGFRDTLEIRNESRYEQYDLNIDLPEPLVPRWLRLPVAERMNVHGEVLLPLDEGDLLGTVDLLRSAGVHSLAIGFLHSYINGSHEQRARDLLAPLLPDVEISLSSEVSPEMREYERISTTCANAYVQPLIGQHLTRLESELDRTGLRCPLFLMLSGGGITTLDTARRFPVRLVESGPAGGAIYASHIARQLGLERVVSYDMGGTTAKLCLINDGAPHTSRDFEVARIYRFMKGSGLPLRIPVIEMVEIGAGGGSIAHVDALGRIAVGPESAGSDPGPACYGQGGIRPTVTDADTLLGYIDPDNFAGGSMKLDRPRAEEAMSEAIGTPLGLDTIGAALGVAEMVDENMSNAARVHSIESGEVIADRTLIAFGGAAPLHAARLAEKLGIDRVVVPPGAGVGSALGFLRAPVAYEVTRSFRQRLSDLDAESCNRLLDEMRVEAHSVVEPGAAGRQLVESRLAYMRYVGQGHEVGVELPVRIEAPRIDDSSPGTLGRAFQAEYDRLYERSIPDLDVEILNWVLVLGTEIDLVDQCLPDIESDGSADRVGTRLITESGTGRSVEVSVYEREGLEVNQSVSGPAIVVETNTATVITSRYTADVHPKGHLILRAQDLTEDGAPS